MLAYNELPPAYRAWNRRHHAPFGRRRHPLVDRLPKRLPARAMYVGPYGWQLNNSTRAYEYPWAYEQVAKLGRPAVVLDVGGGLAGLQWTLARAGHAVINVDPGLAADGVGFDLDPRLHATLSRLYEAPVDLRATTIENAGLADRSVDVAVSVSSLEHFSARDLATLAGELRRLLKPGGLLIASVDLFLDVEPFCSRPENEFGRNIDLATFLGAAGLRLVEGDRDRLVGFHEFNADLIQCQLSEFLMGRYYPALVQLLVATR